MITVIEKVVNVNVRCLNAIGGFIVQNFDFTATQGQSVFTLPSIPRPAGMFILAINGVLQNVNNGDFTVVGNTLALSDGVDAGDHVFGMYEVFDQEEISPESEFEDFLFIATAGQQVFVFNNFPDLNKPLVVAINGVLQSRLDGDFTISGKTLTLSNPIDSNDKVAGYYEKL